MPITVFVLRIESNAFTLWWVGVTEADIWLDEIDFIFNWRFSSKESKSVALGAEEPLLCCVFNDVFEDNDASDLFEMGKLK